MFIRKAKLKQLLEVISNESFKAGGRNLSVPQKSKLKREINNIVEKCTLKGRIKEALKKNGKH